MIFLESFENFNNKLGYGTKAQVYAQNNYAIRIEKTTPLRYSYIKKVYDKIIGKDLKNVVKIYDIYYDDIKQVVIIKMEKLNNPSFTEAQKCVISNFIGLIEFGENDYLKAINKLRDRYKSNVNFNDNEINKMKFSEIQNPTTLKILSDIYNGYTELTTFDIFHMDMKPDNILVDSTGNYKLIDLYS